LGFIDAFLRTVYNVPQLIEWGGLFGLIAVIFSETGLMLGFFLPGDSLLVTAGIFAAAGKLNMGFMVPSLILAAICGNALGYFIGSRAGKALYSRPNSLLFRREHLMRTQEFYEKHGGKTVVIAQFLPVLRTFAPVVAGAATMTYRRFATYNVVGAITWIVSMTSIGYFLGRVVPNIEKRINVVVAVVIMLSLLPALISWLRVRLQSARPQAA
jgi:membrane-associated protein